MTRIVCTADLHENLIDIPECDVLLIAGDVSFAFKGDLAAKQAFLAGEFKAWLERVPATEVVLVAGNHDQSIQAWGLPDGLRCHYLEDAGVELFGLKLWGTPWQPWFHDWAFNAPRRYGEAFLASKFERIPADTDIVICHGPPRGYGDHNGQPDGQPRRLHGLDRGARAHPAATNGLRPHPLRIREVLARRDGDHQCRARGQQLRTRQPSRRDHALTVPRHIELASTRAEDRGRHARRRNGFDATRRRARGWLR
jgi:hypothetical protein